MKKTTKKRTYKKIKETKKEIFVTPFTNIHLWNVFLPEWISSKISEENLLLLKKTRAFKNCKIDLI